MMPRNLEVLGSNFAFSFPTKMLGYIRDNVVSGQVISHHNTLGGDPAVERRRCEEILKRPGPLGVICIAVRPDAEFVARYREEGISLVLIDEEEPGATTIAIDNRRGGHLAGERLVDIGRRRPALICGRTHVKGGLNAEQRLRGFREGLAIGHIELRDQLIEQVVDYSYQDGLETMRRWLALEERPDAVFSAAGDDCAVGVLRACADAGVKVPDEIAVIGFDDMDIARMATPTLTTIRQPLLEIAATAYRLASDPGVEFVHHPRSIVLEPTIVVRQSA